MVTIVRVMKPHTDEIVGFHPNVNTLLSNLAMLSEFYELWEGF
jgi:hypothetical protein